MGGPGGLINGVKSNSKRYKRKPTNKPGGIGGGARHGDGRWKPEAIAWSVSRDRDRQSVRPQTKKKSGKPSGNSELSPVTKHSRPILGVRYPSWSVNPQNTNGIFSYLVMLGYVMYVDVYVDM